MRAEYEYAGLDMCAADGMCQEKCPVSINTGELVKTIREEKLRTASPLANKVSLSCRGPLPVLRQGRAARLESCQYTAHSILGTSTVETIAGTLHKVGMNLIPLWNPYLPAGAKPLPPLNPAPEQPQVEKGHFAGKVVYMPSCVTRVMGAAPIPTRNKQVSRNDSSA